jgi:hypothetical protein
MELSNGKGAMESQYVLARFRQEYGKEYADFLTADWGPPPHLCPYCLTETLRKLLIGDPSRPMGKSVAAKWYMWCESCLRGLYCPPGTYAVPPGKPYVTKGDEAAIRSALPSGLKLIVPVKQKAPEAADSEME